MLLCDFPLGGGGKGGITSGSSGDFHSLQLVKRVSVSLSISKGLVYFNLQWTHCQKVATHPSSELLYSVVASNTSEFSLVTFHIYSFFILFFFSMARGISVVLSLCCVSNIMKHCNECSRIYSPMSDVTMMVMPYLVKMNFTENQSCQS